MNFSIPFGASKEAINAIVERGVDAMYQQEASGEIADVAFLFDEEAEDAEEVDEEKKNDDNNDEENNDDVVHENEDDEKNRNNKSIDNDTITIEDWANGEEEFVAVCGFCSNDPCLFEQNKETLILFDEAEHVLLVAGEDVPANNIRRKSLYRQLTLILNGGPMGAGVRRELPACCVTGVREMHPSESFMGYMQE